MKSVLIVPITLVIVVLTLTSMPARADPSFKPTVLTRQEVMDLCRWNLMANRQLCPLLVKRAQPRKPERRITHKEPSS